MVARELAKMVARELAASALECGISMPLSFSLTLGMRSKRQGKGKR
jgi:hypothetical protein